MTGIRKFALMREASLAAPTPSLATAPIAPKVDPIAAAMDQAAADLPRLLTPAAVAKTLGLTERTLERWRMTGEGPCFVKLSRSTVRYSHDDVAAFVAERVRANTI